MKLKNILLSLIFVFLFVSSAFSEEKWIDIHANLKVTTSVYLPMKNKWSTLEGAIEDAMYIANSFSDKAEFTVTIYKKDDLFTNDFFKEDYIYGSGTSAVVNLKYGLVSLQYTKFDDEPISDVGWDWFYFITLNDNRVLCLSILE